MGEHNVIVRHYSTPTEGWYPIIMTHRSDVQICTVTLREAFKVCVYTKSMIALITTAIADCTPSLES